MKHARLDYDRIQDPTGAIPDDEPVFLLRGQDRFAASAVEYYSQILKANGGNMDVAEKAREQAQRMRNWTFHKDPDL